MRYKSATQECLIVIEKFGPHKITLAIKRMSKKNLLLKVTVDFKMIL